MRVEGRVEEIPGKQSLSSWSVEEKECRALSRTLLLHPTRGSFIGSVPPKLSHRLKIVLLTSAPMSKTIPLLRTWQ